ncbi:MULTISPECIES: Uma2 family endonuclease [Saccharothrix]|uniref:Uma2 family endonuclease n=1 Tax=Saccharothrix TaxID=2071 RepID=UPI003083166A
MTVMAYDHEGPLYTVEDLERMPDDGRRYELIDGMLHVSPAPSFRHQKVVLKLAGRLDRAYPSDMHVLAAPFAFQPTKSTELQPDALVAYEEDFTEKLLPVAPLLAVEVLSPSTAMYDLNLKKRTYALLGVHSYWVVDPQEPKMTVFELDTEGCYELMTEVKGEDPLDATMPYPVRIVPVELLGTWGAVRPEVTKGPSERPCSEGPRRGAAGSAVVAQRGAERLAAEDRFDLARLVAGVPGEDGFHVHPGARGVVGGQLAVQVRFALADLPAGGEVRANGLQSVGHVAFRSSSLYRFTYYDAARQRLVGPDRA